MLKKNPIFGKPNWLTNLLYFKLFKMNHFNSLNKTALLFTIIFFCTHNMVSQTTYNINDPEDLTTLSATLVAGDTVILADGTYTSGERIKFTATTGTSSMPITFRAATPGGVKFTGGLQMNISGDYLIVDGFHWQGGFGSSNFIQFRDSSVYANHSTIQNCAIDGLALSPDDIADDGTTSITKHRWIVLYGTYNSVINCSFMNKSSAGALILAEYQYNAEDDRCATVGHTISNNYFYKYEKIDNTLSNSGDSETIRIGASDDQNVNSNITVSNNYFVEADGENEIITNKSKNNTFTNNTFRRCRGSLVLRHGSNATVDGNYFLGEDVDGTGGIRITDSNHEITNNYIQDCLTVANQAKWNNGITFIGGGDNAAVDCTSTSTSNGYQKSENITVSNNTIINTNAPLFYNTDKGSTDPTGTVSNNLIYFASGDPNLSDVISGETTNSYANMGTTLAYTGNVYTGTNLGATNAGFSQKTGITATANGEIFTFSGSGSAGKGANLGSYIPTTDAMVGYGIGACFLNNLGAGIIDGNCTIEVPESLTVSSLPTLNADAASYNVSVNANVSWTTLSNDAWITINTTSGNGDATVSVTVTANADISSRSGSVTFTQDAGGDDIERTLTVTQDGADLSDLYNLINDVPGGGSVSIYSFSSDNAGNSPPEVALNTLDKVNTSTSIWAAQDGAVLAGDYKGDGEYIIYDLGKEYNLNYTQFSTTNKSDSFGYQIWVSTTGTNTSDFTMALPTTGELLFTATNTMDFNQYEITTSARYVKIVGFGRYNSAGNSRTSAWSTIAEIEFFGTDVLSVKNETFTNQLKLFPNPTNNLLNIKTTLNTVDKIKVFTLTGKNVLEINVNTAKTEFNINVSKLAKGSYLIVFFKENQFKASKTIVIK